MFQMIQNVGKSIEMQDQQRKDFEAEVKLYEAETKRIATVQAGMTEQQIQDIAMGVVAAAMESQNIIPQMREESMSMEMTPQLEMEQGMQQ
jgi:uncharacterized protein (DUF885 family)